MMLVTRLVLVITALVLAIDGEEVEAPAAVQEGVISFAASTNDRQRVDKDENNADHRQGRMALHAEAPSSKAKREQALRNILAARRRQLLGPRMSELPKSLSPSPRTPRPVLAVSKDPLDMLEAQETRHGVYVTAPIGDEVSVVVDNDGEDSAKFISPEDSVKSPSSLDDVDQSTKNSLLIRINDTNPWLSSGSKINDTHLKNSSLTRAQKTLEHEIRRKNTVAMPESLYNHFRPVESNIPVEDMTQFLYFGQKIHPDGQNISGNSNNSVLDSTSTSASVPSSRRRYSMKRFSTTTPIPMPRLEEIINEEMNIALERSTIERNKIPKTKNVFRAPGSGTYFRKSPVRTTDPTIVSNVILTRESGRNATAVVSEDKRESVVLLRNSGKFHSDPSAHAHQVVIVADEGSSAESVAETASAAAHRAGNAATGNAAYSTQLHKDVEALANKEKRHQRKDHSSTDNKRQNSTTNSIKSDSLPAASTKRETSTMITASTSRYEKFDEKFNKITTWQTVHSNEESTTLSAKIDRDKDSRMTSSTINDLTETLEPKSFSIIPTVASLSHSGSLRIVVTEPMLYESGIESVREGEEEETLEDAEREAAEGTVNLRDSRRTGSLSPPSSLSANVSSSTDTSVESTLTSSISNKQSDPPVSPTTVKTELKPQQHAYAYEITNVTRLLRNYTGPGLNAAVEHSVKANGRKKDEEADDDERKKDPSRKKQKKIGEQQQTGEEGKEEEGDSALRRTNVGSIDEIRTGGESGEPTPQQQPLPLLLPTLQRSSSSSGGIVEPARKPGELSAGTDVGEATARSTSNFNTSTGSTPIITSASSSSSSISNSGASGTSSSGSSSQTPSSSSSASSSSSLHLVGERGRKGAVGPRQQYYQQNQNRGSGGIGIGSRNTSPSASTPVTTSEVSGASTAGVDDYATSLPNKNDRKGNDQVTENILSTSTLRWNHTGTNKLAGIGVDRSEIFGNDRRYLRKSVSAVLNQRTVEDGLVKEFKRRRGSSAFSGSSVNNRRIKNSRIVANEEPRLSASRSMENRTVVTEKSEIASSTSRASVDLNEDAISASSAKFNKSSNAMTEKQAESTVSTLVIMNQTDSSSITMETMQEMAVGTSEAPLTALDSPETRLTEIPNDRTEKVQTSAKSVELPSLTTNASDNKSASSTSERTIEKSSESLSTSTEPQTITTLNSVATTQSLEITTTPAPAAFPVTPRMLIIPSKSPENDEVTEVNPESAEEAKRNKTQEASRPFGLAKDLDPSEIQKMYRSQTTLKPEAAMTTIPPEIERSTDYPVTSSPTKDQPRTMNPVNSSVTRKPAGNERSPEVRGRNLSDKSKDKDDVLPIMQLYNTSDIFNGTGKAGSHEATSTSRTLVLPGAIEVNSTRQESEPELATTLEPQTSESSTKARNGVEKQMGNKNREENLGTGLPKKNRHGGREESHESTGPPRWSNHSNPGNSYNAAGVQANRTRYRPYYHTTPPEFIGYRPEFNGSFFEPGMISVSPRESINISEVITKRHDGDTIATQETVAVVAYILATLVVFPIAVGVGLILRRLIIRNRKVLEESDTSSEISCRKDALNLENGDFKTSIEKAITKLPRIQHLCHEAEKPPPPPSQECRWEFPRDKLRLQTVLGQGNFGQVWKAEADDLTGHQGTTRLVAVKTVKEGASAREKEDLVRELEIMQQLGNHPNVVTLLGCCTEEEPHYLILEYVMYGKLLAYLRDHRTRQDFYNFSEDSAALTSRDLTVFGYCVARGMEYLASKKIIHRDLAARNVLVDHNKLCKIADFGMSRFANEDGEVIEARHGRNALPIRWMAPESLIYSLFTTKTDVWSFGILMWEIVTLGSTPYPDMAAREVMRNVQNGYRLERPSHCRSELFRVIARCWHADPDRRPEFQTLRRDMAQLLEDSMNGHYVDLESFASECAD